MVMVEGFLENLDGPTIWAMILGFIKFLGPVWIAFFLGVMVGWAWKPRRESSSNYCKFEISAPSSPLSASISAPIGSIQSSDSCKISTPICNINRFREKGQMEFPAVDNEAVCSPSKLVKDDSLLITFEDLEHLCRLVERKDGGPPWKHVMDRSAHGMSYQAWQRDPEGGPPQYCSRTVYEDATPELLRDFFWDDEFRLEWDDMIINSSVIEECSATGTMLVHWTCKFPFFCSDREYIAGRRIWESGRSYYCVTKGVPCLSVPRKDKPRRVDLFYSSWYIRAVESPKGDGQLSACEVILFHHEDMGIPRGIAKFGVRRGMWGAVKNIERGFRSYQNRRASGSPLSHYAFFAQINTRLDPNELKILEGGHNEDSVFDNNLIAWPVLVQNEKLKVGINIPKLLIVVGVIAMACSIDQGVLPKMLILGFGRKLQNIKRGALPSSEE